MALIIPNENNKHQCKMWVHIAIAPAERVGENRLPCEFEVNNEQEPNFKVKLLSMIRYRFEDLPTYFIALSSGLDRDDFFKQYLAKNTNVNWSSEMAVYLYERI